MTDIALHLKTIVDSEGPVAVREADPDTGFVMRLLMLCALPRTNPGPCDKYVRSNGAFRLAITANPDHGLPYGSLPRLMLAWMCSEAAWTQARSLAPGRSLHDFMRRLGLPDVDHTPEARMLQDQLDRLCDIVVNISYAHDGDEGAISGLVVDHRELWWDPARPQEPAARENRIVLSPRLYRGALRHPVPVDIRILGELAHSPLGLDLYSFLACRGFSMTGTAPADVGEALRTAGRPPRQGRRRRRGGQLSDTVPSGAPGRSRRLGPGCSTGWFKAVWKSAPRSRHSRRRNLRGEIPPCHPDRACPPSSTGP